MWIWTEKEKVNLFSCDILVAKHLYLMEKSQDKKYWSEIFEHFRNIGLYERLAKAKNIDISIIEELGYGFIYSLATHFLSLAE